MTTSKDTRIIIVLIIKKIMPACGLLRPDCLWPTHRLGSRRTRLWQGIPCLLFVYLYLLIVFCNLFIPFLWPGHPVRQDCGQVRLHPPFLRRSSQGGGRLWLWARWAEFLGPRGPLVLPLVECPPALKIWITIYTGIHALRIIRSLIKPTRWHKGIP